MSEREPQYETGKNSEIDTKNLEKLSKENFERMRKDAEKAESKKDSIEAIHERIEQATKNQEAPPVATSEKNASETPLRASTQLKGNAYRQTVRSTQRKLKPSQRAFSKVVHQPIVESISDAAEGTIARPSGLLFAGLLSVVSSLAVLYICRHYGYEYNFMIGLACLALGFVVGLLLEGAWRLLKRN